MKVRELIELLKKCDAEEEVLVASDGEGNSFRVLSDAEPSTCNSFGYDIDVGIRELTHELAADGFSEEDVKPLPCVVLY